MAKASRSVVIDASPELCYQVVTDLAKYPEFVDELKAVKILSEQENKMRAEFTAKVIKEIKYTLDLTGEPGKVWKWTLVKGFMKKNDGLWLFKDLGDGRTEATYEVDVEFGLLVPSSVVKMLNEVNLPKMLNAFKKRIESLA